VALLEIAVTHTHPVAQITSAATTAATPNAPHII
jgi:hypothetical protein